jgi:RHS repeat-associated protein
VFCNLVCQYGYEAYGAPRFGSGSSVNPFRYVGGSGYYYDPDTTNYWLRARYYGPALARFLSRDPLAFPAPARNLARGQAKLFNASLRSFGGSLPMLSSLCLRGEEIRYPGYRPGEENRLLQGCQRRNGAESGMLLEGDLLGRLASLDLYQYVRGNPINREDPSGELEPLSECLIGAGVGGFISAGFSVFSSYVNNENSCQTGCKALINFLAGALGGCLGTVLVNPCIATVIANLGATAAAAICDHRCGCPGTWKSLICSFLIDIIVSLISCVFMVRADINEFPEVARELYQALVSGLSSAVGSALGVDFAAFCGL